MSALIEDEPYHERIAHKKVQTHKSFDFGNICLRVPLRFFYFHGVIHYQPILNFNCC